MSYTEITATEIVSMTTRETRLVTYDFTSLLASGETISTISGSSGGQTLGVSADAAITVGTPAVNVATITKSNGETIAIGKAVQVRLTPASGVVGTTYPVTCLVLTSASNRIDLTGNLQVVS